MSDLIVVTNWEEVDIDDFYLSDDWSENKGIKVELRKMAKNNELFVAYVVNAKDYCIYGQMDASQIFINRNMDEIMHCEGQVIGCEHEDKWEYEL